MADDSLVMTVRGPVPAATLGPTMVHEHLFIHLTPSFSRAPDDRDGRFAELPVTPRLQSWLRFHSVNNRDNLVLEDPETALAELDTYREAGGGTLVDLTVIGLNPRPDLLAAIAARTDVHIVAATGFYQAQTLPPGVADWSEERMAETMRRELQVGIGDSAVRAGIIGELGVSDQPAPVETRALAAAAQVQRDLGYAVNIHPGWGPDGTRRTVEAAERAGLDPGRTIISHLDNRFGADLDGYLELARRGFRLGLDCCGKEDYYPHVDHQLPTDSERVRVVLGIVDAGFADRLFLAQDVCTKHQLLANGGQGYAHVLRTFAPRLRARGVDEATLTRILVDNPRTLLGGARLPSA